MPGSANPTNYALAAAEFLCSLRGDRSQRAFARRLGYRTNPITDWEHGRRSPTAVETLRAAALLRVDVPGVFARFHPAPMPEARRGVFDVAAWLDALRGSTTAVDLARRAGVSRFAVGRWLRGEALPRLPDFFALVDAATGRLPDFVAAFGLARDVPSLRARLEATTAAREAAYVAPWSEAILRVLECVSYRSLSHHDDTWIAARLDIPIEDVRRSLRALGLAHAISKRRGLYRVTGESTVDTRGDRERVTQQIQHWSDVGRGRIGRHPDDVAGYNVFSVSEVDAARAREILRRAFREIRSLVAASEPVERVCLLNVQLVLLDT